MKNRLVVAGLFALAGCSEPVPTTTSESQTAVYEPETAIAEKCPELRGYTFLPEGVAISTPYHLRSDRIYPKNGQTRRRVAVEVLESDASTAMISFEASIVGAGFVVKSRKDRPDGEHVVTLTKKGAGATQIIANSDVGKRPFHPGAKGLITIDYQMDVEPGLQADVL